MPNYLLIPGSLHKNSLNHKILEVCAEILKSRGINAEMISQADLDIPLINTDKSRPSGIDQISEKIKSSAAVLIGCPEYNAGISPVLKNLIDWTSTLRPHPWKGKPVFLVGSSPGDFGANLGLLHSRVPLDRLGARVWPQPHAIPRGDQIVQGSKLTDENRQKNLEAALEDFAASL